MENDLLIYHLKIEIKPSKADEFIDSVSSLLRSIRNEKGCLDLSVYCNSERENTFIVVGEWKTPQAMEEHFKTHKFDLLIGAARVLGETYVLNTARVMKTGALNWPLTTCQRRSTSC